MKESYYPEYGARIHTNELAYATIAFRAFCDAEKAYLALLKDEDRFLDQDETFVIDECIAICETFSAFAVEGYLNTYAAACLGDDVFYDNFEKLSVLSKLQLIAAILYHESIDKGGELYYLLKSLFSARDSHAHSKSVKMPDKFGSSAETIQEQRQYFYEHWEEEYSNSIQSTKERFQSDIKNAELSIKAIAAVACFIDAHDCSAFAVRHLLPFARDAGELEKRYREKTGDKNGLWVKEYREDMRKKGRTLVNHYSKMFN